MSKFIAALFTVISFLIVPTAQAASSCYTPSQFEAEQGLRIQSELMVIALTCMKAKGGGKAMYDRYLSFNRKNQALISGYESDIMSYFRSQGQSASEERINNFKTGLANHISKHAISMSTVSFCQNFGGRIDQALAMDQTKLRRWAQQVWPNTPASRPMCAVARR